MPQLKEQYAKALRHNKRVRLYRHLLVLAAVFISLAFASAMLYPYIKSRMVPKFIVQKALLERMRKSSIMQNARLRDYSKGAELYNLHVGEAVQDYNNRDVMKLKDMSGRFILSSESWLDLSSSTGLYNAKTQSFTMANQINLVINNAGEKSYATLPGAVIKIKEKSLYSEGGVRLTNGMLDITAQALQIENNGKDLQLSGQVKLWVKDKKYGEIHITSRRLQLIPAQHLLILYEKVQAERQADIIKSDKMQLHYHGGASSVDKIMASGHVYLKHQGDIARGCKLQMDVKKGTTKLESCAVQASISLGE